LEATSSLPNSSKVFPPNKRSIVEKGHALVSPPTAKSADGRPARVIRVAGVQLASASDPLWAGLGLHGSHSWGDGKYTVHDEALVKAGLANAGANYALGGTVGMHIAW
jgi:hypothetical protein